MYEAAGRAVASMGAGVTILISKDTRFIVQGITGREAVNLTRENLDYGARSSAASRRARRAATSTACPVYDSVRDVVRSTAPSRARSSRCRPGFVRDAAFEALENGVELIVIVTENIPRKEVAQMVELAALRGARIIGPNCLGIISPGEAKMGGVGGPAANTRQAYSKGPIGVMSRSGGMTTEIASTLTAAGLGQSTCVSIGGDAIVGTSYAELDAALRGRSRDAGDRDLLGARRADGGRARRVGRAAQVAAADRRVHGRALHGRDEGHALRARRHDRRGQGRHDRREDRAHGGGRDLGGRAHRGDPHAPEAAHGGGAKR
jgi:hypothetical protein